MCPVVVRGTFFCCRRGRNVVKYLYLWKNGQMPVAVRKKCRKIGNLTRKLRNGGNHEAGIYRG